MLVCARMIKPRITVLLVEDHTVVREGIRKLLEMDDDLDVVGEAKNGRQALALVQTLRPAVVVMDVAMASLNGLEATRQILAAVPGAKIIILSAHIDAAYLKVASESGAMGFLHKHVSLQDLSAAIRAVHQRKAISGPRLTRRVSGRQLKLLDRPANPKPRAAGLTAREMEVLQLIAEGKASKEIAADLGIGIKSIEKHREHLTKKLGIHGVAGLTHYAIQAGIIESSVQLTHV